MDTFDIYAVLQDGALVTTCTSMDDAKDLIVKLALRHPGSTWHIETYTTAEAEECTRA